MSRKNRTIASIAVGMAVGGVVGIAAKCISSMFPRRRRLFRRAEKSLRLMGAMLSQMTKMF
jgi:hypothetical protein